MNEERYEIMPAEEEVFEEEEEAMLPAPAVVYRLGAGVRGDIPPVARPLGIQLVGAPEPEPENELSDIFEVPQPEDNDMYIEDLVTMDAEEGVDDLLEVGDLFEVKREDGMGTQPAPKVRRTRRLYPPIVGIREVR